MDTISHTTVNLCPSQGHLAQSTIT
jgi:hypothetical protein